MKTIPTPVLFALLPLYAACASTPSERAPTDVSAKVAPAEPAAQEAKAGEKAAEAKKEEEKSPEKKKEEKQDELRKKQRELDYSRRSLKIARLSAESEQRAAKAALEKAEFALGQAIASRDHQQSTAAALTVDEAKLSIERATEYRERQRQELAELEEMYKQEDLAKLTKELVIRRSRMDLELAAKSLALEERKLAATEGHELPKKTKELEQAVVAAERDLAEAKAKVDRLALEKELALLKAEHEVDEAERAVKKLEKEIAELGKPVEAAAPAEPTP